LQPDAETVLTATNLLDPVWIKKDGKSILMCEMETSHIVNCLNMLLRSKEPATIGSAARAAITVTAFVAELRDRKARDDDEANQALYDQVMSEARAWGSDD